MSEQKLYAAKSLRLTRGDLAALNKAAADRRMPASDLIREALREAGILPRDSALEA